MFKTEPTSHILHQRLIYNADEFFRSIILHLSVNVHSCLTVFMPCEILNCLGIYTRIEQIRDICVTELVWSSFKIHRINNIRIVLLVSSHRRLLGVFDPLTVYHLVTGALFGRTNRNILPYSLELRICQWFSFAVCNHIIRYRFLLSLP